MYMQNVKVVENCEKNLWTIKIISQSLWLRSTLVTGAAAPAKQIKSQVFLSSYLFSGMSNEYVLGIHN